MKEKKDLNLQNKESRDMKGSITREDFKLILIISIVISVTIGFILGNLLK
jgi:hypothetical protein